MFGWWTYPILWLLFARMWIRQARREEKISLSSWIEGAVLVIWIAWGIWNVWSTGTPTGAQSS